MVGKTPQEAVASPSAMSSMTFFPSPPSIDCSLPPSGVDNTPKTEEKFFIQQVHDYFFEMQKKNQQKKTQNTPGGA